MSWTTNLSASLASWFGLPTGYTPKSLTKGSNVNKDVIENDYVSAILDITVDDICIGENPVTVVYDTDTPSEIKRVLNECCVEFNHIVRWAARDLCKSGVSIYMILKDGTSLRFIPYIRDCTFYFSMKRGIVVLSDDKVLDNVLVFLNYSKDSLTEVTGTTMVTDALYEITPEPMQLKNADAVVSALQDTEDSILKYRKQLARILRFVTVDVGASQGDQIQTTIDSISSSLNANSIDLQVDDSFDDALPVIPHRRGIGKPELVTDIPSADIKALTDLEYFLGKLNLVMRFPASYMDFSKELGESAVSMIRSDLRYAKLCFSVQSVLQKVFNTFINSNRDLSKWHPEYSLTKYPSSEDDDLIEAFGNYVDLSQKVDEFISSDKPSDMVHKLDLLQTLFNSCMVSSTLNKWFEEYRQNILNKLSSPSDNSSSDEGF